MVKKYSVEQIARQFVQITGTEKIKPAVLLMCGDHGIAKHGVSAFPQEVTLQMMQGYGNGTAAANVMAEHAGADVFVVDVGTVFDTTAIKIVRQEKVAKGTADFTQGAAMTEQQVQAAMSVGMKVAADVIAKGYNLLITAEMGIGNTTSTAALLSAMLGLPPEDTVGRGSGINDERLKKKLSVVAQGLAVNKPKQGDGLDCLKKLGGFEHAALVGAMLAGMEHNVPTLLDGVNATAAALCAWGINKKVKNFLLPSHLSAEIGHNLALKKLGLHPVLDMKMRLGEGTGACLLVPLLRIALRK